LTDIILQSQKEDDDEVVANQTLLQTITVEMGIETMSKFRDYLSIKYHDEESIVKNKLNEFDDVLSLGIEQAKKELEPILFEEKKPRKDVLIKLGKITNEFLKSPTYPDIRAVTLRQTINKSLGISDERTIKKYERCIQQYIGNPRELGLTDVSSFVDRMPKQFVNTTSSSSSCAHLSSPLTE